jgi:hypothetical protein
MILFARAASSFVLPTVQGRVRSSRVHSVFEHTVNIAGEDGTWLSLHPESVPMHPYAVRVRWPGSVPSEAEGMLGASPGEVVTLGKGVIELASRHVTIETAFARRWDPGIDRPETAGLDARERLALLGDLIGGRAVESMLLAAVLERPGDVTGGWASALTRRAGQVVDAIREGLASASLERVSVGIRAAVGMGCGFTPSGDDYLTGLFGTWLHLGGPPDLFGRLRREVTPLLERTSLPSAMMIRAALEGWLPEPLGDFIRDLAGCSRERLARTLDALIRLGATSGEDMLAGSMTYFRSMAGAGCVHALH